MTYSECLDKAGHEWLRIEHQNTVFYMEYELSDTERAEEKENDLVYNYYMYKKIGRGKASRGNLGKDGRGVEEYDGGRPCGPEEDPKFGPGPRIGAA